MFSESWQILSIALSLLAAAIQIAGLATPLWIWIEDDDDHIGIGLFYRVGFESDGVVEIPDGFEKIKFDSDQTIDTTHWTVMLSMEVVSTIMAIFLIPVLVLFRHKAQAAKQMYGVFRVSLWVSIFACVFNGAGLVVFIIYHGDILTEGPDISVKTFSWGGLICACGVLLHFCLTLIIFQCIWPDEENTGMPAPTDPKMNMYPTPTNANISEVFQSYYNTNANKPKIEDVGDNFRQGQDPRLPILPPLRDLDRPDVIDRRVVPYSRARSPPPIIEDRRRLSTEARRVDAVYGNGLDNRGFAQPPPVGRQPNFQRQTTTTILDRQDQFENVNRRFEEEVVFNRIPQNHNDQRRSSLYRDIYSIDEARKKIGDFLGAARPSADRDVYRESSRHLSHANKFPEQRLAPLQSNLTESNVKQNHNYMYRPFSETVYGN